MTTAGNNNRISVVFWLLGVAALLSIVALALFYFHTEQEPAVLGQSGDFFGGILNPILTFLTFVGILMALYFQVQDLRLTREELSRSISNQEQQIRDNQKQYFEATFFRMLQLHNALVDGIDLVKDGQISTKGRDCFRVFYQRFTTYYHDAKKRNTTQLSEDDVITKAYEQFWRYTQADLSHYYRYLYNMVKVVAESNFSDDHYMKLIRAQLSDQELLLLFYNCLSEQGAKFRPLVEKYSLLDNMPPHLLSQSHYTKLAESAFGGGMQRFTADTAVEA